MRIHENLTRSGLVVRLFALILCWYSRWLGARGRTRPTPRPAKFRLATATDPGHNPFMASVTPPPADSKPGPKLTPKGNGKDSFRKHSRATRRGCTAGRCQQLGVRDREKMIAFLQSHPPEAQAFVGAEHRPFAVLEQGFDVAGRPDPGLHPRDDSFGPPCRHESDQLRLRRHGPDALATRIAGGDQAVALVDAHGVPRARCYCGNPLTAPRTYRERPTEKGVRWTGYNPGAVVVARPSATTISSFALVDVVTGCRSIARRARMESDTARKEAGGPFDGSYSGSGLTVSVENGRIVRMSERIGGTGCELAIAADFAVDKATGTFSGPWTSTVISGDCTGANGTMDGKIAGGTMTFNLVNQSSGRSFTNCPAVGSSARQPVITDSESPALLVT